MFDTCGAAAGADEVMVGGRPDAIKRSANTFTPGSPTFRGGAGGGTKISVTFTPAIGSPLPARVTTPSTLAVPGGCWATRVDSENRAQASRAQIDLIGLNPFRNDNGVCHRNLRAAAKETHSL
jgi:hypothetical protein